MELYAIKDLPADRLGDIFCCEMDLYADRRYISWLLDNLERSNLGFDAADFCLVCIGSYDYTTGRIEQHFVDDGSLAVRVVSEYTNKQLRDRINSLVREHKELKE